MKKSDNYTPNHISASEKIVNIILSISLLSYGTFGIIVDNLYLPGKRLRGVRLHGEPALIMYLAFILGVLNLLSVIIDHYDIRNNERNYKAFTRVTQVFGWFFFTLSLVLDLVMFH